MIEITFRLTAKLIYIIPFAFVAGFPDGCVFYRGPNPISCYESIWIEARCSASGYEYPGNSSATIFRPTDAITIE